MTSASNKPAIILFDGVCNLCTGSLRFVIEHDANKHFKFAALQSSVAKDKLPQRDKHLADELSSIILIDEAGVWFKSTAALRISRKLSGGWPLLQVLLLIPRPLRDALYDYIGKRRYQWFGYTQSCWLPKEDISDRFID